jgi:hypothetical protein
MRLLLALALILPLAAQDWNWVYSGIAAHAIGSAVYGYSSWGCNEMNPILGNRFQHRAVMLKSVEFGATAAATYLIARKYPRFRKVLGIVNLGMGGVYSGMAVRNWRTP